MQRALKKMQADAREGKIELLYMDEAGFSCVPNVQRSWSPLGQAHSVDASVGRKRVNVLAALDCAGNALHFQTRERSVDRTDVIDFLQQLATQSNPDKWTFVVMDNASMHHNIDYDIRHEWMVHHRFTPLYIPAYSPELNLIEIVWKHAKYHWREFVTWSKHNLVQEVHSLLSGFGTKFHVSFA